MSRTATWRLQRGARAPPTVSLWRESATIGCSTSLAGATHTSSYTYGLDGQPTGVTRDGTLTESYGYDLNGNRLSRLLGGSTESASYDAQDRLLHPGTTSYLFDADGFLSQRGSDTFQYDARGQLLGAMWRVSGSPTATTGSAAASPGPMGRGRRSTSAATSPARS